MFELTLIRIIHLLLIFKKTLHYNHLFDAWFVNV